MSFLERPLSETWRQVELSANPRGWVRVLFSDAAEHLIASNSIKRIYVSRHMLGFTTTRLVKFGLPKHRPPIYQNTAKLLSSQRDGLFQWTLMSLKSLSGDPLFYGIPLRTPNTVASMLLHVAEEDTWHGGSLPAAVVDLPKAVALTWLLMRVQYNMQMAVSSPSRIIGRPIDMMRKPGGYWYGEEDQYQWMSAAGLSLWPLSAAAQPTSENSSYELATPPETLSEETRHMPQSLTKRQILSE